MMLFSVSVAVGHACTQAPHETHSESMKGLSWLAETLESNPRAWVVGADRPFCLANAPHAGGADDALGRMEGKMGVVGVLPGFEVIPPIVAVASLAKPHDARHVLQLAMSVGGTGEAVER